MFRSCFVLLLVAYSSLARPATQRDAQNDRPIIAILAQLVSNDIHNSYIAASYIKYVESAGGRAVLIPTSFDVTEVTKLFSYVNGVLYPGGSALPFTSDYYKHAKTFYDLAIQANKNGDYFPIWGTCLGFQTLHMLTANTSNVITDHPAEDISFPLNFTHTAKNSRIFKDMPMEMFKKFSTENFTYNHHGFGVSPDQYETYEDLKSFYDVLSTNFDVKGQEFVSMVEAFNYPFYGSQWHPEKNNFEFPKTEYNVPHSVDAVLASQYMANFFVNEARKSGHKFPSKDEENKYLSYNYVAEFSGKTTGEMENFAQIYMFPAHKE